MKLSPVHPKLRHQLNLLLWKLRHQRNLLLWKLRHQLNLLLWKLQLAKILRLQNHPLKHHACPGKKTEKDINNL